MLETVFSKQISKGALGILGEVKTVLIMLNHTSRNKFIFAAKRKAYKTHISTWIYIFN